MLGNSRMESTAETNVVVIGSGLSAVGAIKALVKKGIRPTVLDWGETLDVERTSLVEAMARKEPAEWSAEERKSLDRNSTVNDGSSIPKKLIFGSDYFYGKSRKDAPVTNDGNTPPFSYALGGLSVGWGAAILPPQACDIADWPVDVDELNKYCELVLADLPYSSSDDGLSLNFPVLTSTTRSLKQSHAEMQLLAAFQKAAVLKKDDVVFGQARLLVNPAKSAGEGGCKYCGQCMSGCVYRAIYKASDEIKSMQKRGEINYIAGCLVDSMFEKDQKTTVKYFDATGKSISMEFDRIFLAAGAVNSARVVLNSLSMFDHQVQLKTRGGFVVPVFSFRKLALDWPNCNTQPGIFLEIKGTALKHWVHVQISTENELLLQKLNIQAGAKGIVASIKQFIASHIVLTFVNYHSDHGGHYKLWLTPSTGTSNTNELHSSHQKSFPQLSVLVTSGLKLFSLFAKIGCLPLFPLAKLNSGAYHVGGTLPMREKPTSNLETDALGRISAWKRVHIVDSSIFPSLPGTTIGLLTMANAYRIVDKIHWAKRPEKQQ